MIRVRVGSQVTGKYGQTEVAPEHIEVAVGD